MALKRKRLDDSDDKQPILYSFKDAGLPLIPVYASSSDERMRETQYLKEQIARTIYEYATVSNGILDALDRVQTLWHSRIEQIASMLHDEKSNYLLEEELEAGARLLESGALLAKCVVTNAEALALKSEAAPRHISLPKGSSYCHGVFHDHVELVQTRRLPTLLMSLNSLQTLDAFDWLSYLEQAKQNQTLMSPFFVVKVLQDIMRRNMKGMELCMPMASLSRARHSTIPRLVLRDIDTPFWRRRMYLEAANKKLCVDFGFGRKSLPPLSDFIKYWSITYVPEHDADLGAIRISDPEYDVVEGDDENDMDEHVERFCMELTSSRPLISSFVQFNGKWRHYEAKCIIDRFTLNWMLSPLEE